MLSMSLWRTTLHSSTGSSGLQGACLAALSMLDPAPLSGQHQAEFSSVGPRVISDAIDLLLACSILVASLCLWLHKSGQMCQSSAGAANGQAWLSLCQLL